LNDSGNITQLQCYLSIIDPPSISGAGGVKRSKRGRLLPLPMTRRRLQWLPEQTECGNAQIGKSAAAPRTPMIQK